MRKQLLASAAALAFATTMTTSSMAFALGGGGAGGGDGSGFDGFSGGAIRGSYAAMPAGGVAGHGWHGGRRFAGGDGRGGPGVGLADYRRYCSPSYDRHGYCGSSYTIGW